MHLTYNALNIQCTYFELIFNGLSVSVTQLVKFGNIFISNCFIFIHSLLSEVTFIILVLIVSVLYCCYT